MRCGTVAHPDFRARVAITAPDAIRSTCSYHAEQLLGDGAVVVRDNLGIHLDAVLRKKRLVLFFADRRQATHFALRSVGRLDFPEAWPN